MHCITQNTIILIQTTPTTPTSPGPPFPPPLLRPRPPSCLALQVHPQVSPPTPPPTSASCSGPVQSRPREGPYLNQLPLTFNFSNSDPHSINGKRWKTTEEPEQKSIMKTHIPFRYPNTLLIWPITTTPTTLLTIQTLETIFHEFRCYKVNLSFLFLKKTNFDYWLTDHHKKMSKCIRI